MSNQNRSFTRSKRDIDVVYDFCMALSALRGLANRQIYVVLRGNGRYARFFVCGGFKRRPTDSKMLIDLTGATEITKDIAICSYRNQVKDSGVELDWDTDPHTSVLNTLARLGEVSTWSGFKPDLTKVHVADSRGVLLKQSKYINMPNKFRPQEPKYR